MNAISSNSNENWGFHDRSIRALPALQPVQRYRIFYSAVTAMREQHMVDKVALVWKFRGAYGRLCHLVASALADGLPQQEVLAASRGKGPNTLPIYTELRTQRAQVNSTIMLCRNAGMTDNALIETGRQARTAVEQEFMLKIPRM